MRHCFAATRSWVRYFNPLLDLLVKANCPLCQRPVTNTSTQSNLFCQDCERRLLHCQLKQTLQGWQDPLPLFAWGAYNGALRQAIAMLKYQNQPQIARPLGDWLAQSWLATPVAQGRSLVVVPIPMYADKQKQRGFNQADLLAEAFCQLTGLPLERQGLIRTRATEAQFGLTANAREHNLTGAFQVGPRLLQRFAGKTTAPKAVLLLDDIYTTGATARTAVQALSQHQIPVYGMVAIARSQKGI